MKTALSVSFIACACFLISCGSNQDGAASIAASAEAGPGQSAVQDNVSQKNAVQVAASSGDHTTLVRAVQAAELVDALSNAGPFTVFAPTNEAFSQLPAGTVDALLKAEKKDELSDILQYHVSLGVYRTENLSDGQIIGQVNGDNITVNVKDGKYSLNGKANIIASIPASNGIVYIVDQVLLPPSK